MSVERKKVLILCLYVNNVKVLIGDGHSLLQLHLLWVTGYFQSFSLLTYKQRSILFTQSFASQFQAKRCSHLLQWAKVVWRAVDWTLFSHWTRFSNFVSLCRIGDMVIYKVLLGVTMYAGWLPSQLYHNGIKQGGKIIICCCSPASTTLVIT